LADLRERLTLEPLRALRSETQRQAGAYLGRPRGHPLHGAGGHHHYRLSSASRKRCQMISRASWFGRCRTLYGSAS